MFKSRPLIGLCDALEIPNTQSLNLVLTLLSDCFTLQQADWCFVLFYVFVYFVSVEVLSFQEC